MFVLKLHVTSVCFKYFKCFRDILQVFYTDVAKVDRDIAHVAMVFQVYVPNVLFVFKRMLQVFLSEC